MGHGPYPNSQHHHYRHNHQRHPQHHSQQQHRYGPTRKNGSWRNHGNYSWKPQGKNNKEREYKVHRSQDLGTNLELSEPKNLLLPQDKWAGVQPTASENILSATDRNPKKSKLHYHFTFRSLWHFIVSITKILMFSLINFSIEYKRLKRSHLFFCHFLQNLWDLCLGIGYKK